MQLHQSINSHRLLISLLGITALFALVAMRLYFIQILHAPFFTQLARTRYTVTVTLPAQRGIIYDRTGKALALPSTHLSAFISREHLYDHEHTLTFLHENYPLAYQGLTKQLNESVFWIARGIDDAHRQHLHTQCRDINFIHEPQRWYPQPHAPHVTGFTTTDTTGLAGTERWANMTLAGMPTTIRYEPTASGSQIYYPQQILEAGHPGNPVTTSLDSTLQFLLENEVAAACTKAQARRGHALVINPDTGEILSLVQVPSFNPNQPALADPSDRRNHALSSCHEFGSTMMIFSALAALAEEVVSPEELIACDGRGSIVDTVEIINETPLNTVPFWQVVAASNNVGIAKITTRLGKHLYDHLQRLGFGASIGVELTGENAGFITPPSRWSAATAFHIASGYEVMATLIQIGRALAIIANGGYALPITLRPVSGSSRRGAPLYDTEPIKHIRTILQKSSELHAVAIPGTGILSHIGSAKMLHEGHYTATPTLFTFSGIVEREGYRRVIVACLEEATGQEASASIAALGKRLSEVTVLHEQALPHAGSYR